jgi:septal ring factor EnvC (AmiA/AmiB activator)
MKMRIFAFSLCLLLTALAHSAENSAQKDFDQHASQQQLEQLKSRIQSVDKWLNKANSEKSGLSKQLRKVEREISRTHLKIKELNSQVKKLGTQVVALRKTEKAQQQALQQQTTQLTQQLKAIYLQGKQPAIKLLLDSDDPQNLSRYMQYFSYLKDARGEKIKAFESALDKLDKTKRRILEQQAQISRNKDTLRKTESKLKSESIKRKKVLAKLEQSIASESKRLQKLKDDQARLEALLHEVEQAIANLSLPSDSAPFGKQKAKLPWPTHGKVRERFGSRIAQGKLRSNGIKIATRANAAVQAVHYGHVVFSDWLRGFGLLLIIDHGEGYMSLYGNNKSLLKEAGDWVSAGEQISYAGDSGGASESGLYFEIRRHGKPLNPSKWLRKN